MLRFVKSRPESTAKALEMFRGAMAHRSTNGINEHYHELHPHAQGPWSDRQRAKAAHYFGGYGGIDRDGSPYFVVRIGQADVSGFAREPDVMALMVQADFVNMETLFRTVRAGSAATGSFLRARIIVDLQGFSWSAVRHLGVIQGIMKLGPQVFPEGASKARHSRILALPCHGHRHAPSRSRHQPASCLTRARLPLGAAGRCCLSTLQASSPLHGPSSRLCCRSAREISAGWCQ